REEQARKRREQILDTALNLFIRRGFSAAKISDIAEAAGMSVGLLFHYFDSKEKVYEELIKLGQSSSMHFVSGIDRSRPIDFFEEAAARILELLKTPFTAKMFVLMNRVQHDEAAPETVKALVQGGDSYRKQIPLVKAGQKAGEIRAGDPLALVLSFWLAIQGFAEHVALHPDAPFPESAWIVDIIRNKN
ncbi:MAG: TetR/AcrR family transcriptional regulator, partial [Treponema sp.]|nr:TetR/AcrR family transcriptional regulator [Treponema sp.]